ncbi:putative oxidoreductase [Agrobacterium rubi TR3 = NBRC 13261]|uniref:Putative oxidoreductase n=1 Tax=Agrobacterium rubi TR3 = NBRC 13261 TaxID=1368415 RepID=A0A081CZM4_9HYPH|nr:SDR family oxidoreductase [Agrobacterium rubi]MBP1880438.1 NADP-dependent 3-hydroxy acid dehydrogenase YdfG [Agrobacterium rubi]MCL6654557.1 short-chain dehydrogenase [Agrobacterium rubi]GAK72120.1 putative oxidoreductase [Agrobacterium rubi TR3 = NBRC 13261]
MELRDAVVMITGASSGIGKATARAASTAGAKLILLARRKDRLAALAAELGTALAVECDVTRPEQVEAAVRAGIKEFGQIDVLVNNAGQGLYANIGDIAADDFKAALDLNAVAPLVTMQAVIPGMRERGRGSIINVSSGATLAVYAGSAAYTSSKAALNMLSRVARLELADDGIVVSTIHPSITSTEFYGSVRSGGGLAETQEADTRSIAHSPDFVADAILALVRSGEAERDLVPEEFGGSLKG